jgi:hypothetical protein
VKLSLIGYGAIGKHVESAGLENIELVAVLVKRPRNEGKLTHDPDRFFAKKFDAVAECAGHDAVRAHGQRVLEGGADFLVTSVGAFTDTNPFDRLLAAAKANGRRLILPSAGIGALDILSSAAVGGLDSVTVTVRKDPSAWKGTVAETMVDLDALTAPNTVFDGPVREGARLYSAERQHLRRRGDRRARPRPDARGDRGRPDDQHAHRRARSHRRLRPVHVPGGRRGQRGEPQDRQAGRHGDGEVGAPARVDVGRGGVKAPNRPTRVGRI